MGQWMNKSPNEDEHGQRRQPGGGGDPTKMIGGRERLVSTRLCFWNYPISTLFSSCTFVSLHHSLAYLHSQPNSNGPLQPLVLLANVPAMPDIPPPLHPPPLSPPLHVARRHSPTIDHAFYPHLLDHIIAHSPPASLLALRATSRAFHDRLTPLLYTHVTLRAAPRNRGQVHAPAYPFEPLRILQGWRDEEPRHLAHTRVLDLCAAYFYGRAAAFPRLKVIRHPLAYKTWPMPRFAERRERRVCARPGRAKTAEGTGKGRRRGDAWGDEDGPIERSRRASLARADDDLDELHYSSDSDATDSASDDDTTSRPWLPPEEWEPVTHGVYVAYLHLTHPRWHEEHNVPGLFIDPPEGTRRVVLHLAWDPAYPRVRFADIVVGEVAMHADIVIVFEPLRNEGEEDEAGADEGGGKRGTEAGEVGSSRGRTSSKRRRSHTRSPSASRHQRHARTPSQTDDYYDPLRANGLLGNLAYSLMNRVIEYGVSVTFVGVERCTPTDFFLPAPTPSPDLATSPGDHTVRAARTMLRSIFDSVLVLPQEFGWDCMSAWRSMSANSADGGWFDGEVSSGLMRHFRFESLDAWRARGAEDGGEGEKELRALESGKIEWEVFEERVMGQTRTFARRP